jgi:hypothetical protein
VIRAVDDLLWTTPGPDGRGFIAVVTGPDPKWRWARTFVNCNAVSAFGQVIRISASVAAIYRANGGKWPVVLDVSGESRGYFVFDGTTLMSIEAPEVDRHVRGERLIPPPPRRDRARVILNEEEV